jgi:hypothetical protein
VISTDIVIAGNTPKLAPRSCVSATLTALNAILQLTIFHKLIQPNRLRFHPSAARALLIDEKKLNGDSLA